jgi:Leucine-rich repeat (LRR) protein
MELKINKKYIHSLEDFIKTISEENKDIDVHKSDETKIYESIILIKNYLATNDLNNIIKLEMFNPSINKLQKVNFTANNIELIPEIINSMKELKILILNNNKIQKISNLENLIKLEKLELRGNKITKVEGLNNLKNLTKITLSCNLITNIEENDFPKIDTLIELGLFGNYLGIENKTLDKNINEKNIELLKKFGDIIKNKFKNLKGLYIGGNFFTNLNIINDDKENEDYKNIIKSIIPEITIDG